MREEPDLGEQIDTRAPYRWAEVVYVMENEYVERLDDLLDRQLGELLLAPQVPLREKIQRWLSEHKTSRPVECERGGVPAVNRVFVINPKAGRGMDERGVAKLEAYFRRRGSSFHAILSQSRRDDVINRTRKALRQGAEQIVAVGGDGTVNAVANGFFENGELVRPDACLAIAQSGIRLRLLSRTDPNDPA